MVFDPRFDLFDYTPGCDVIRREGEDPAPPAEEFPVTCSCGKKTTIYWSMKEQKNLAVDLEWKYLDFERGWCCGNKEHSELCSGDPRCLE